MGARRRRLLCPRSTLIIPSKSRIAFPILPLALYSCTLETRKCDRTLYQDSVLGHEVKQVEKV